MTHVAPIRVLEDSIALGRLHLTALGRLTALIGDQEGTQLSAPAGHALVAGVCRVAGCRRAGRMGDGLCRRHCEVWRPEGEAAATTLDAWLATATAGPLPCRVAGCSFGRVRQGLCAGHGRQWRYAKAPDLKEWLAAAIPEDGRHPECQVHGCRLWATGWDGFCLAHSQRFHKNRGPHTVADLQHLNGAELRAVRQREAQDFILAEQQRNDRSRTVDVTGLEPRLQRELTFLFHAYLERGPRRVALSSWATLVDRLQRHGASTLTAKPTAAWTATLELRQHSEAKTILRWGCDQLDRALSGEGWEHEYDRDIWRLDRLGYGGRGHALIRFDRISQTWLGELAKQWTRHRLCTGIAPGGSSLGVRALTSLSRHLASLSLPPVGPCELTHDMIQGWVSGLTKSGLEPSTRMGLIGQVSVFLREVHRRGWAPDLPATTMVFPEDFPARPPRTARGLSEHVMAQLETPESLSRLPERHRLVVEVLIRCGLRTSDALGLDVNCLIHDADGHTYLQYLNHKMRRTAFVPIDEDLATRLGEQRRSVLTANPTRTGALILFPSPNANPTGTKRRSSSGLRNVVLHWLSELEVTDEQGLPVHLTLHQFRHTFGTRLINRDVPQHIVQQLLDHTSPEMTAHYARLHDRTVREAWAKAQLLDVQGNPIPDPAAGALAEAAWTRRGLEKAKQTLPNGYCGMPLHSPCEHANACLTCPLFITSSDFLPQHRTQLSATRELIDVSKRCGHQRLVDANEKVAANLQRIITACEADTTGTELADAR